jgi:rubrerythrin
MTLHTAAEGITFAKKLEDDSARFYEQLANQYNQNAGDFLAFAKENKKNIVQIDRTYYGVITDAIEGGYAFKLNPDEYIIETAVKDGAKLADMLKQAVKLEETIVKFYTVAAEQSRALMADIPRAFLLIAKKRADRLAKLKAL